MPLSTGRQLFISPLPGLTDLRQLLMTNSQYHVDDPWDPLHGGHRFHAPGTLPYTIQGMYYTIVGDPKKWNSNFKEDTAPR